MTWLRNLRWLSVFNLAAASVCAKAAFRAFTDRDLLLGALFVVIACSYLFGVFLALIHHSWAGSLNQRLRAAGIYLFAGFTTAVTVDDLMFMAEAAGHPFSGWQYLMLSTCLIGSLELAFASLAALIKPKFGDWAALVGAVVLCPYFALVAWNLPWRDFVWLVTIHWDGRLNVTAILSLAAALAYSTVQLWPRNSSCPQAKILNSSFSN